MQAGDLALEDGEVVGDEGQGVVDLVGDPGGGLAQAGQLGLLEHPALRLLQLAVGLLERLVGTAAVAEAWRVAVGPAQAPGCAPRP